MLPAPPDNDTSSHTLSLQSALPIFGRGAGRQACLPASHRRNIDLIAVGRVYAPDGFCSSGVKARPGDSTQKAVGGVALTYDASRCPGCYRRSVGSSAPPSGWASGTWRPGGPISQRQNTQPRRANRAEANASWTPLERKSATEAEHGADPVDTGGTT